MEPGLAARTRIGLVDASKPPLPAEAVGQHDLLAAPFRYVPPTPARFRVAHVEGQARVMCAPLSLIRVA